MANLIDSGRGAVFLVAIVGATAVTAVSRSPGDRVGVPPPAAPALGPRSSASQTGGVVPDEAGLFVDGTEAASIEFIHVSGAFGMKWLPETNGAGVSFLDADGDGWIDLLFPQGTYWDGHEAAVDASVRDSTMRLFRNRRDGTFEDITERSGLAVRMYGFAAAPADYDNDGDTDIYITAFGPNRLFRNEGGGRFREVTDRAGVSHPGWGSSAAWLDYDHDGDLDLFACNYLRWQPATNLYCSIDGTTRSYCNPQAYLGEPSVLYRNDGAGRFVDVTREAGVYAPGGKALGVAVVDHDADGWADLAVANDTEPNFLFVNQRDGTFEEVGMASGMAVDSAGLARAGMGIDAADYRNDGRWSIAVGNFSREMIGLFEPKAPGGVYVDVARRSQLGRTSLLPLTFALFFYDYNLDGWLDLLAINGHVYEQVALIEPGVEHAERPLLYRNEGDGRFREVSEEIGGPLQQPIVGRGGAYADVDRDGDLDVAVTTKEGPAYLWINRARDRVDPPHVLRLLMRGNPSSRDALGAVVTVSTPQGRRRQMVRSGSSYVSQSERVLTFGLGPQAGIDAIEIDWPGGNRTLLRGDAVDGFVDHEVLIDEQLGVVGRTPLNGAASAPYRRPGGPGIR